MPKRGRNRKKLEYWQTKDVNNDSFTPITETLLTSEAFMDLSHTNQVLYILVSKQYYGKRKPITDHPGIGLTEDCFYFSRQDAIRYGFCTRNNSKKLYDGMRELESHGFIKSVSNGKANRQKSIYKYSGDWKTWKK